MDMTGVSSSHSMAIISVSSVTEEKQVSSWCHQTQAQIWKDLSRAQGNPHLDSFTTFLKKWTMLFALTLLSNKKNKKIFIDPQLGNLNFTVAQQF